MTELEWAATIGALATILTFAGGVYASRRFGLPGLARSVENEQAALILAQKGRIEILELRVHDLEVCQTELQDARARTATLEGQVADNHAELVRLYRLTGQRRTASR